LGLAALEGSIDWGRLAADGFFSAGKGGGKLVDYGHKDKGYDTESLRTKLLKRKIYPLIALRRLGKTQAQKKIWVKRIRWQVERAISWLQRKFRRLVVRWERKLSLWKAFLNFGLIKF
jgi:hypothetical protein